MTRRFRPGLMPLVTCAIALLSTPTPARSQSPEGTISGIMSDGTGAALPGVTIAAVHRGTGQRVVTTSTLEGFYVLRPLPIGDYVIEAELQQFQKYRREGLTITSSSSRVR